MRGYTVVGQDSAAAELFFPSSTGELDKVSVYLVQNETNAPTGDVIASIQTVATTVDPETEWGYAEPSGTKLAQGSTSVDGHVSTDGSFSWMDIPLSQPALVEANQSLALILETTSGSSEYTWGAGLEFGNCGGHCVNPAQIHQNGTWSSLLWADNFFFKTYVDASTTTPPASDTPPPKTTITGGPAEGSIVNSAEDSFSFTSDESGSSFRCKLDTESECTSPKSYTDLSEGPHTFYVRAIDPAGNLDSTPASRTWTVDTTAPKVDTLEAISVTRSRVPLRKTDFMATFSEKMDTTTLTTSTFKLFKCSSAKDTACTTQIDASVKANSDGLSATLNPYGTTSTLLAKNTRYKVVVTTGAKDLAGNALAQEKSSYFNIGSS
jgi:hypothetical protein